MGEIQKCNDQHQQNIESAMEEIQLFAELDLGVLLQRWLAKLTDATTANEALTRRDSIRRVSRLRSIGSFNIHKDESRMLFYMHVKNRIIIKRQRERQY